MKSGEEIFGTISMKPNVKNNVSGADGRTATRLRVLCVTSSCRFAERPGLHRGRGLHGSAVHDDQVPGVPDALGVCLHYGQIMM